MKNYPEADSGKIKHSNNALDARFAPGRVFVAVLSLILILLSFIGAFAVVNSPHAIAATVTANVGINHTLPLDDTTTPSPTSTITSTPTPTSTLSPTATPTMTPAPTSTSIPSPTSTAEVSTPSPAPSTSPTSSISPTRASSTTVTNATPGASGTVTAVSPQNSVPGQTPTTTSNANTPQSTPQEQQKNAFPFIALAIGVPGITVTLAFFLIGWWLLRKRLLPSTTVKLPPSGANSWSRVRPNEPLDPNVNDAIQPEANNTQSSNGNAADAYEQWLRNNSAGTPDLNDPYLKELIKQLSDKTWAVRQ
jgi:hypothetical protein